MRIRKISQIVFVLKKKTPHEYDSGTSKIKRKESLKERVTDFYDL